MTETRCKWKYEASGLLPRNSRQPDDLSHSFLLFRCYSRVHGQGEDFGGCPLGDGEVTCLVTHMRVCLLEVKGERVMEASVYRVG